ncbi:hypothetical protein A2765_01445 [Candidatus Kaiserbacteria bacterium RIFCSPHIGHO2_01_FULL_56_24]|uniref:Uncharacterized protein n=1 Tax=Candidatus Kaiserbacteria bacterium RIFCSPHIGHO2_01_FULL_56_24 TaxID=1798487 RepID=A0A1F6DHA1_9BACT|nr:MAG: hypothetical protein A2765_01445 [Candidatus Kaiserbacteria bacterium RIFCSPHIGHO2_01_FULL_56_24]
MHLLKGIEWTPRNIAKAIVVGIIVVIFASFVFSFVRSSFDTETFGMNGSAEFSVAPMVGYGGASYGGKDAMYSYDSAQSAGLSARNVASSLTIAPGIPPIPGGYTTGNTAEQFEVTEYSASIETRDSANTCGQISELKSRSYVIFENANESDTSCDYRFKVEHARVPEILAFVKGLDPKDFNENTYTIKDIVDDFSSETEILTKKRDSIDDTLKDALAAYDEITSVATQNQDASSLAKIIDSKINLIQRLTQERIDINTQLDRLARAKADQLDRLAYTYFNVSAYENKYLDKDNLKDSWKNALRATVHDVNQALQDMSLGLLALLFIAIQWIIYGFILLFAAKYVWKFARKIWMGHVVAAKPAARNGSRSRTRVDTSGDDVR